MYIHIGENKIVNSRDILGIFQVECLKQSRNNLRVLNLLKCEKSEIKSVIFVNKKDKDEIRFSISSIRTLKDRLEKNGNLT